MKYLGLPLRQKRERAGNVTDKSQRRNMKAIYEY
jgi:hypothetical protein